MAQYITHPAEAGAQAADRFGLGMLQGLSEQTSNFVNNAALQMRQIQEQKAKGDAYRSLLKLGINPVTGGAFKESQEGQVAQFLPEPGQELARMQIGLQGRTLPGGQVAQNRLFGWAIPEFWPRYAGPGGDYTKGPLVGGGDTAPTAEQLMQFLYQMR